MRVGFTPTPPIVIAPPVTRPRPPGTRRRRGRRGPPPRTPRAGTAVQRHLGPVHVDRRAEGIEQPFRAVTSGHALGDRGRASAPSPARSTALLTCALGTSGSTRSRGARTRWIGAARPVRGRDVGAHRPERAGTRPSAVRRGSRRRPGVQGNGAAASIPASSRIVVPEFPQSRSRSSAASDPRPRGVGRAGRGRGRGSRFHVEPLRSGAPGGLEAQSSSAGRTGRGHRRDRTPWRRRPGIAADPRAGTARPPCGEEQPSMGDRLVPRDRGLAADRRSRRHARSHRSLT